MSIREAMLSATAETCPVREWQWSPATAETCPVREWQWSPATAESALQAIGGGRP